MPFSSCIPDSQKFLRNDLESSYYVILEHLEPLLMNQGITYGRMLREWGDSIPMLPDMPVDDSWKIPGTPGQGSDRPRKSWFPVMNGLVLYVFFSRKSGNNVFFPIKQGGSSGFFRQTNLEFT
jgi:hypothetical protein